MGSTNSSKLHKTISYKANSGKPFKYEIFQTSDGTSVTATVSTLDEIATGSEVWTWVVIDPEVVLLTGGENPEFADAEALQHFLKNYAVE